MSGRRIACGIVAVLATLAVITDVTFGFYVALSTFHLPDDPHGNRAVLLGVLCTLGGIGCGALAFFTSLAAFIPDESSDPVPS